MQGVASLTDTEAMLRIAMLVARADGVESATERARASQILGARLAGHDEAKLEGLVTAALDDVETRPANDVLARVRTGIRGRDGAMEAMHVACQVAIADNKLAWQESRQVFDFADSFGLTHDDVRTVLHTYWPPRTRRGPT